MGLHPSHGLHCSDFILNAQIPEFFYFLFLIRHIPWDKALAQVIQEDAPLQECVQEVHRAQPSLVCSLTFIHFAVYLALL